jgi:single-strand DNA-binding protein
MADVTFTGNIGNDPEIKFLNDGKAIINFSVAEGHRKKDQSGQWQDSGTTWWRVSAFGYLAEQLSDALAKGQKVLVQGRSQTREYTSKDGTQGKSLECVANSVGIVPKAQQSGGGQQRGWGQSEQATAPF